MELTQQQKYEIIEDWVKNLRSGEYEQGKYKLVNEGKFCCLGVLANTLVKKEIGKWENCVYKLDEVDSSSICLSNKTVNLLGFDKDIYDQNYKPLWQLNDRDDYTFDQIANVIEEQILPKYKE